MTAAGTDRRFLSTFATGSPYNMEAIAGIRKRVREVTSIDGKYRVLSKLGDGLSGFVYLVESAGERIALKQLRMQSEHSCLSPEENLENFKQEFSTLTKLSHPHILQILDFGYDRKEKLYYFTTEYIEGLDIYHATRQLPYGDVEDLFVQTLRALSYLHSQHIYHLDIKPSNILVQKGDDGRLTAKIIDFGLAAFRRKGMLAGSPPYLAPESILEEKRDGRSDIYSLGATWYTCLTGQNPFEGANLAETITLQKVHMPPPVSERLNHVPGYLDAILEKMLKKNPADRYHRADQVIRDLNWNSSKKYPLETKATALSYLPGEGSLVGRQKEWDQLIACFNRVFLSEKESHAAVLITGGSGTGKTRLLRELKFHAQLQTVPVIEFKEPPIPETKRGCVLLIDNLRPEHLDALGYWRIQLHPHPVLLVLTCSDPKMTLDYDYKIGLENFKSEEVREFIASVIGVGDPPEYLTQQLHSRSKGNPLLLKEILFSLIMSQQIFDEKGRWSPELLKELTVDFSNLEVPKTLKEFCEKKYRALPPECQKILIALALAKYPLTRPLFEQMGYNNASRCQWTLLEEEDLVSFEPTSGSYRLLNPSFQEWIQQNVPPHTLVSVHQDLGAAFSRSRESEEAAWYHMGFGLSDKNARYRYLLNYGDALLKKTRYLETLRIYDAALALAPSRENRVEIQLQKSRALFFAGRHHEALKLLEELQTILKKEGNNPQQKSWIQQTYREMCNIYLKAGRLDLARESLQVSSILLDESPVYTFEKMTLDNFKGSILMREGKLWEAAAICEETRRLWESWPLEDKKKVLNNELPTIFLSMKDADRAKNLFQADASFYQAIGNTTKRAYCIYGWAESCCALQQFDEAANIYRFCIDLSRELKNEELLLHAYTGLGNIAYFKKDWKTCLEHYQHSLELAQHRLHSDYSIAISINIAIVFRHLHDLENAELYLTHVIEILEGKGSLNLHQLELLTQSHVELAKVQAENDRWLEARDSYRDALKIARHNASLSGFRIPAGLGLVKAAQKMDRPREAQKVLQELEKLDLSGEDRERLEEMKSGNRHDFSADEADDFIKEPETWDTVTISFKSNLL